MAVATLFVPRLRKKQRARIEKALARSRDPKYRDKCRAILCSSEGHSRGEIARLLRVHETTVGRWVRDYLRFGFEGLEVGKSPGRPRRIDAEGEAALREALEHNPRDLGYAFTRWTRDTLAEYLYAAVHIRVSSGTVGRALHQLDYRYKRPKLSLKHKQDRRQVRRAREARDRALKKGRGSPIDPPSSTSTNANSISIPA